MPLLPITAGQTRRRGRVMMLRVVCGVFLSKLNKYEMKTNSVPKGVGLAGEYWMQSSVKSC